MTYLSDAQEIAVQWQSPGTHGKRFAELASTGQCTHPHTLMLDIEREISKQLTNSVEGFTNMMKLFKLAAFMIDNYPELTCDHVWQAGAMIVHDEDVEEVAAMRLANGSTPPECGECGLKYGRVE